jgi:hypothetical protein
MKLADLLARLDRSRDNRNLHFCFTRIAEELELYNTLLPEDMQQCPLSCYTLSQWYCTDSYVGIDVYYFQDECALITQQQSRGCSPDYYWASAEMKAKVFTYIDSLQQVHEADDHASYFDPNEEMGEYHQVSYSSELLTSTLLHIASGERVTVKQRWNDDSEIYRWSWVKVAFNDGHEAILSLKTDLGVYYHLVDA